MSVIGPMKMFDPFPIPFQSVPIKSVPIEMESEKIGTRLIDIGMTRCRYLDAFPYLVQLHFTSFLFLFLRVNHSKNAIVKPASKSSDKDRKDVDKAMRRVKEASSIIEDEIDPGNCHFHIQFCQV